MVVRTRASASDVMAITNETLQQDIKQMSREIGRRIDAMEDGLAEKIKTAVHELIADVKAELYTKLLALEARVMALESKPAAPATDDRSLNFVICEMAESEHEDIVEKVNNLVTAQLSLPNVRVEAAVRKPKPEGRDAGVILAKCSDFSDRKRIMEAKSKLNTLEHFKHIRIYPDKPRWQRQQANVRSLVKSMGTNKLFIRGGRVCERGNQQDWRGNANVPQGEGQPRGHYGGRGAGRGAPRGNRRGAGRGNDRGGNGDRGARQ